MVELAELRNLLVVLGLLTPELWQTTRRAEGNAHAALRQAQGVGKNEYGRAKVERKDSEVGIEKYDALDCTGNRG